LEKKGGRDLKWTKWDSGEMRADRFGPKIWVEDKA